MATIERSGDDDIDGGLSGPPALENFAKWKCSISFGYGGGVGGGGRGAESVIESKCKLIIESFTKRIWRCMMHDVVWI